MDAFNGGIPTEDTIMATEDFKPPYLVKGKSAIVDNKSYSVKVGKVSFLRGRTIEHKAKTKRGRNKSDDEDNKSN